MYVDHIYQNYRSPHGRVHCRRKYLTGAVATTSQPARIELLFPSGGHHLAVCELTGGGIPQGKRATLECGPTQVIPESDTADDTGDKEVLQDSPQNHVAPGSVGDQAVCRHLRRYCCVEPIPAKNKTPEQLEDGFQDLQLKGHQWQDTGGCQRNLGTGAYQGVVIRGIRHQDRTTSHVGSERKSTCDAHPRSHRSGVLLL